MTSNSNEKASARDRAERLGISYAAALADLRSARKALSPIEQKFWVNAFAAAGIKQAITPVERTPIPDGWAYRFETLEQHAVTEVEEKMGFLQQHTTGIRPTFRTVKDHAKAFELTMNANLEDVEGQLLSGWEQAFTELGLHDATGKTPIKVEETSDLLASGELVRTITFEEAEGVGYWEVRKKAHELGVTMKSWFLEVREGRGMPGRFQIVTSTENPLNAARLLDNYEDELLVGPAELPNLRWGLGVDAKHDILWDDFADADVPHLNLFAGTKGGKSTVIQGMLLQLMGNNTPDQLELVLVEPKIGLETWGDHAHVTDVLWMLNPPPAGTPESVANHSQTVFLGRLAHILTDAVDEMRSRNQIFSDAGRELHGQAIGNILEAWDSAQQCEAERPDLAEALRVPTRLIVIEEAILGLSKPQQSMWPLGAKYHTIVMGLLQNIAVAGRSAGIHLVMVAQEANKNSFPEEVKRQSRKIALKLYDAMAALNAIGMTGPEELPGYGHAFYESSELGWVRARAFYPTADVVGRLASTLPKQDGPKPPPMLEIRELKQAQKDDPNIVGEQSDDDDGPEDIFPLE